MTSIDGANGAVATTEEGTMTQEQEHTILESEAEVSPENEVSW
jgi:hypothetical protein